MSPLDPTVIVGTLAGVISVLAGIIFKVMTDRIALLQTQNDKLQDRLSRELDMGRTYSDMLGRILIIVEGLRYEGRAIPATDPPAHAGRQHRPPTPKHEAKGEDRGGDP